MARPHILLLCAFGAALWLVTVAWTVWGGSGHNAVLRVLVAAFAVGLGASALGERNPVLLLSPLYLLGCLTLVFFSALPALYAAFAVPQPGWGPVERLTVAGVGSAAETLILQFAAFCLLAAAVAHAVAKDRGAGAWPTAVAARLPFSGVAAAAIFLAALIAALRFSPSLASGASGGIGRQLSDGLPPLLSLCLAALGYLGARGDRGTTVRATGVILLCVGVLLVASQAETPLYIALAALGLMAVCGPDRLWRLRFGAAAIAVMAVFFVGAVLSAAFLRAATPNVPTMKAAFHYVTDIFVRKLVLRGGVPVGCLQAIVARGDAGQLGNDPFYFRIAVVPRALWPDKPSLSRGSEYAADYCGKSDAFETRHSESITLVGEPLLHGGLAGLAVAQGIIAAGLGTVTVFALAGGPLRLIALAALLPWLIAFQQHFALYMANATKMFLFMTPALAVFWWLARRRGTATTLRTAGR